MRGDLPQKAAFTSHGQRRRLPAFLYMPFGYSTIHRAAEVPAFFFMSQYTHSPRHRAATESWFALCFCHAELYIASSLLERQVRAHVVRLRPLTERSDRLLERRLGSIHLTHCLLGVELPDLLQGLLVVVYPR